jgi:hypothetical protein
MPEPTTPQTPAPAADVSTQLSALAEAMRQLAESHKTLLEAVKPAAPAPPAPAPPTIAGDPVGGVTPGALAAIDYSKLSPLQQITLGLRTPAPTGAPRAGAD